MRGQPHRPIFAPAFCNPANTDFPQRSTLRHIYENSSVRHLRNQTRKHNLKDPRLDQADKLVEADKKTNAQVE